MEYLDSIDSIFAIMLIVTKKKKVLLKKKSRGYGKVFTMEAIGAWRI